MKRQRFGLAVATALAFGAVALPANATTITDEGTTWSSLSAFWSSIASNWWTHAGTTFVGTYSGSQTTPFGSGYASVVDTLYSWSLTIAKSANTYSALGTAVATSANGHLTLNGNELTGSASALPVSSSPVETVSGTYLAAPGPVAAAGLPALLALAGFLGWRRRQAA